MRLQLKLPPCSIWFFKSKKAEFFHTLFSLSVTFDDIFFQTKCYLEILIKYSAYWLEKRRNKGRTKNHRHTWYSSVIGNYSFQHFHL